MYRIWVCNAGLIPVYSLLKNMEGARFLPLEYELSSSNTINVISRESWSWKVKFQNKVTTANPVNSLRKSVSKTLKTEGLTEGNVTALKENDNVVNVRNIQAYRGFL